jgi:hypothetical protein
LFVVADHQHDDRRLDAGHGHAGDRRAHHGNHHGAEPVSPPDLDGPADIDHPEAGFDDHDPEVGDDDHQVLLRRLLTSDHDLARSSDRRAILRVGASLPMGPEHGPAA